MGEATITIPSESVRRFRDALRAEASKYAGNFAESVEGWSQEGGNHRLEDAGADMDKAQEAIRLAGVIGDQDGPLELTGDAWVLSDTADKLLVELLTEAKDTADEAPCEYREVVGLAERITAWARVCERVDETYRRLDIESREVTA